jgi:hypothetical protein
MLGFHRKSEKARHGGKDSKHGLIKAVLLGFSRELVKSVDGSGVTVHAFAHSRPQPQRR